MAYLELLNDVTAANGQPTAVKTVRTITTVAGASLVDGERVTIDDGKNGIRIFEFDTDGVLTPTVKNLNGIRVAVGGLSADQVRDALIAAINGAGLEVVASSGGAATVTITATLPGAVSFSVGETVVNAGFVVANTTAGSLSGVPVPAEFEVIEAVEIWTTGAGATVSLSFRLWVYNPRSQTWEPFGTGAAAAKGTLNGAAAIAAVVSNQIRHFESLPAGVMIPQRLYLEIAAGGTFDNAHVFAHVISKLSRRTA
jgi:hypothetical protein